MVYKAEMQRINTTTTVAVKSVAEITTDFRKEVTIMSEVVHPNIVRLYGLINEGIPYTTDFHHTIVLYACFFTWNTGLCLPNMLTILQILSYNGRNTISDFI